MPKKRMLEVVPVALTLLSFASGPPASAQVSVPAAANIFGAGHATAPGPGGAGGGLLPTLVAIPAGTARTVQFLSASGSIDYGTCCPPNAPDGIAFTSVADNPLWDGIAGTSFPTRGRYLVGVFLDDTEPVDPAPSRLAFADGSFSELSPGLRQVFFVGDGLTGDGVGAVQTFHVPDDATRLFLGTQDRCSTSPNVPGWYDDNTGTVSLTPSFTGIPTNAPGPEISSSSWGQVKSRYE